MILEVCVDSVESAVNAERGGADNLVIGCLTREGRLAMDSNARIIEAAKTTPVNLHRAFDMCRDMDEALKDAKSLGLASILTSGGCASALEGLEIL